MRRPNIKITPRRYPSGKTSYCVDAGMVNQKRRRRFFPSKEEAQEHANKLRQARTKNGELAFALNTKQLLEATHCFERVKEVGATLTEAIDYYLHHNKPKNGKILVSDLIKELLAIKEQNNFKPRYLKSLRTAFQKFSKDFGTRYIHEVTKSEFEGWLNSRTVSPKKPNEKLSALTKRNYLRDLGMLFKHAEEESYCAENLIKRIKKPHVKDKAVEIFQVCEARIILSAAVQFDRSLVPCLAIGFFAGLRSSELEKLDWNEINLDAKRIEVKSEIAKTARRRMVTMSENLCAWLKPYEKMEGLIAPIGWQDRRQKLVKQTELTKWPKNVMRHSFGSYHFAHFKNANQTAMEMGHESNKMLFAHYRELVTPEAAAEYWEIYPPKNGLMFIRQPNKKRKPKAEDLKRMFNAFVDKVGQN